MDEKQREGAIRDLESVVKLLRSGSIDLRFYGYEQSEPRVPDRFPKTLVAVFTRAPEEILGRGTRACIHRMMRHPVWMWPEEDLDDAAREELRADEEMRRGKQ